MGYEEIVGTDEMLVRLIQIAGGFEPAGEEFLIIPPGGVLKQSQFMRE